MSLLSQSPQLQQISNAINQLAPWELAESWDNVGLQVGRLNQSIQKIMVAVDLNDDVLKEGLQQKVDGFIIHHPLIFKPLNSINPSSPQGNLITQLLKNDLFLIVAHTNMDKAVRGINHFLADLFELTQRELLDPSQGQYCKMVVFVPEEYAEIIRKSMADAGAGTIGDYRECSFGSTGLGTFLPGEMTQPFIGKTGIREVVKEVRLEMVALKHHIPQIMQAVLKKHPYEEPAIDVYPLLNLSQHGLGYVGNLPEPVGFGDFCRIVQQKLGANEIRVMGKPEKRVEKVALCSGSGKGLISKVIQKGADVYITADLGYHDYQEAAVNGLAMIDAGHWTTEKGFVSLLRNHLTSIYQENQLIVLSSTIEGEPYLTLR